jgi:tetratricopeptide (TPR) repeat protein
MVLRISMALVIFVFVCLFFLGTDPLARILNGYSSRDFTLGQRLLTETRIVFHYLGLLILPLPSRLNLAYDYPLSTGLLTPPLTLLALFGIILLVFLVFFLYRRDRLTGFALFWFLVNLVIESSVIPLEIVFEHRMYMPSLFLVLAAVAWCYRLLDNRVNTTRTVLLAIALLLSVFTWQRNRVWQNEISLWTDVVHKAPNSMRANANLGNAYSNANKYHEADRYLLRAIDIGYNDQSGNFGSQYMKNTLAKVHDNLGLVYRELKNYSKAIVQANLAIELNPSQPAPLLTLGIVYSKMNEHQRAYMYFKEAAGKGLDSVDLFNNWAVSSYNLGKTDQAIRLLNHALVLNPEHPESHYNLGIAYSSKGMLKEAQREMALAMQLRNKSKK